MRYCESLMQGELLCERNVYTEYIALSHLHNNNVIGLWAHSRSLNLEFKC